VPSSPGSQQRDIHLTIVYLLLQALLAAHQTTKYWLDIQRFTCLVGGRITETHRRSDLLRDANPSPQVQAHHTLLQYITLPEGDLRDITLNDLTLSLIRSPHPEAIRPTFST
jgi:hypothetical protein